MNSKYFGLEKIGYILVYFLFATILITSLLLSQIDYQDSWVLEGLVPQIFVLSIVFMVVGVNLKRNRKLTLFIASFLMIISIVPALKYVQISGVFDSIAHYGYTNRLISLGHVPESGFYSNEYSGTPGMHIFLASFSLVTGLSTTLAINILLIIVSGLTPFIVYFLTKNTLNATFRKYVLLACSFSLPAASVLTGTTFAIPLYFIFISVFLRQNLENELTGSYSLILILTGIALIFSHAVTSLFLTIILFSSAFILKIYRIVTMRKYSIKISRYVSIGTFLAVFLLMWWLYNSEYLFNTFLVRTIRSFLSPSGASSIPSAFFQLNLFEQLTLFYIRFYELLVVVFLGFFGLILYFTAYRKQLSDRSRALYVQIFCILIGTVLLSAPFFLLLRSYTFERFITYSKLLSPMLIGLSIFGLNKYLQKHLKRTVIRNLSFTLILLVLFVPIVFAFFIPQPLIPKNDENEYIVDYRSVNTFYQKSMIEFIEEHHVNGTKVVADYVTSWQIFGLTSTSFYLDYLWENPLYENVTEGDIILLHYSGIAGPLNEQVDYRTRTKLNEIRLKPGNHLIYDNGESFTLFNNK